MKKIKRLLISGLCLLSVLSMAGCTPFWEKLGKGTKKVEEMTVNSANIPLKIWYDEAAPFINECSPEASMMQGQDIGWQNWSLPIGNGFVGVNVFGRTESERIQVTEKTLSNPWQAVKTVNGTTSWPQVAGLNNFSETYIDFNHESSGVSAYRRELDLRTSIASTSYEYDGAKYEREYFVSYPDNALVIYLTAEDGPLSFTLRPTIPFEQSYMNDPGDGLSKTGTVTSSVEHGVGCIELSGKLGYYDVDFVGYYRVYTNGGTLTADTVDHKYKDTSGATKIDEDGVIRVEGATSAIIVATFGTDYELCTENFENGQYSRKKQTAETGLEDARAKVEDQLYFVTDEIADMSVSEAYEYLKGRHLADYQNLFGRVDLDLDCDPYDYELTTDKLLEEYNKGNYSSYLEALLFQYGRYLIIASSREGSLPANLQGAWNCYNVPAWSSGYWSNINIQMNYWHVFSTNLAETFIPYVDYNAAYMEVAEKNADDLIAKHNPSVYDRDGGNGWTMGVSGNPFFFNSDRSCGNLGLLTQVFYEYYEFTKDEEVLQTVYDVLANAARFVTKCVKEYDGKYLVEYCDSPEMYVDGVWYYTTGTTYAQTLAYINNYAALECARDLGIDLSDLTEEHSILSTIMEQIDLYDPINVGLSGQIKEFREEDYYGSLGNPNHRHISQLVGLYPGNLINSDTSAWMDAALVSLAGRNEGLVDWPNGTTANNEASIVAWAWAHKQALYARAGEGDLAQEMLAGNLRNSTLENLLMVCGKIFQIEASSGTTAAIAEMLLQSDEEFIEILPAIPTSWSKGSYTGLVARGNFEVSVSWNNGVADKINVLSKLGGSVSVKYPNFDQVKVYNSRGEKVAYTANGDVITFNTTAGETYYLDGFAKRTAPQRPEGFGFDRMSYDVFNLRWNAVDGANEYRIYVAYENDPAYTLVGTTKGTDYTLSVAEGKENVRKTFAVSAVRDGVEGKRALCYSNPISTDLEVYSVSWRVKDGKLEASAIANESAGGVLLYARSSENSAYELVASSEGMSVVVDYDASKSYAVIVTSKYTDETSKILPLTASNSADNILNGMDLTFVDGKLTVDLEYVYELDELSIRLESTASVGNGITIERLYGGEWYTVASCSSANELKAHLVGDCLVFDMEGGAANKIRITHDGSVPSYDVTLSGSATGELVDYTNVLSGKEFVPTSATAGNIYNASYGYQTLTDGIIYEEYVGRYSSKQNGGRVEAILDLEGVHNLSELKIYLYKDGLSKCGTGLVLQALFGGEWTTVINCESYSELEEYLVKNVGGVGDWLVFDLGDVYASKIKLIIPAQTSSGWTTLYEIECLGVSSTVVDPVGDPDDKPVDPNLIENIFVGKQFTPTAEAKAQVLTASWFAGGGYETLTDGNKVEEQVGRFSTVMNNTTAFMDATIDLGSAYELSVLRFYLYDTKTSITESSKRASIGKDILIQVYANGKWTDVVSCKDNAALCEYLVINEGLNNDYLEFDLGGIRAEKVRFYISGSATTSGITFQEIECSGKNAS